MSDMVSVSVEGERVVVRVDGFDPDAVSVCRSQGLSWEADRRRWSRRCGEASGAAADRAAEAVTAFFRAGFPVECDPETERKALDGDWSSEWSRWVTAPAGGDGFRVRFERDDELWGYVHGIRGSRWDRDRACVTVPAERWRELDDLSRDHGFRFTERAAARMAEASGGEWSAGGPGDLSDLLDDPP